MLIDSSFTIVKDTYALDEQKTILAEEVMQAYNGETVQKYDADNHYIEMTFPMHDESGKNVIGVMLVSVSTDSIPATLAILKQYALMRSSFWSQSLLSSPDLQFLLLLCVRSVV